MPMPRATRWPDAISGQRRHQHRAPGGTIPPTPGCGFRVRLGARPSAGLLAGLSGTIAQEMWSIA